MSALHPRNATVTWTPPSPPNGLISNYSICVCPGPVCSGSVVLSSSSDSNPADRNLGPSSPAPSSLAPGSGATPMPHVSLGSDGGSSTIPGSGLGLGPDSAVTHFVSAHANTPGSVASLPAPPGAAGVETGPSPVTSAALKGESSRGRGSDCFTAASDLRPVSVAGNITTSTLLDLLPFQTYRLQVQCNSTAR